MRIAEASVRLVRGQLAWLWRANCGSTVGLAMDRPTSTVGPGQLWILISTDGPPFLAMHKGHIFGSIKLANVGMGNLGALKAKLQEPGYDGDGGMVVGAVIAPEVIVHLTAADMHIDYDSACNAARPRLVYSRVAKPPSLMYIYYRGEDLPPVATILPTHHTVPYSIPRLFSHIPFLS